MTTTKICNHCKEEKPLGDFHRRKDRNYAPLSQCRQCKNAIERANPLNKEYRQKSYRRDIEKSRAYSRDKARRSAFASYGITESDYERMLLSQGGVCAICKSPASSPRNARRRNLDVDHCHTTGQVRGLLCGCCNRAIGQLNNDVTLLFNAAKYLTPKS
jgi:hypothetical protein